MSRSKSIAIVGYAARLPGAANAKAAWDILQQGRCVVSHMPSDRFSTERFYDPTPDTPGKSYSFHAGILDDPFHFDAAAFGISPLEARQMDPQQRILLETVQHAFDHAGINPHRLDKHKTGVYVGASSADHSVHAVQDAQNVQAHFMLGNTLSILANRVSFQWDFRGPSLTVDTACSSGLVAFDSAVADLTAGKIDAAIVAGINLLLSPLPFVGFSQAHMLSPDGLCRPFSDAANGYVRAEGAVAFVLRRADIAAQAGDKIRSHVIGTATNTDGRKSGITYPSAASQEQLLRMTLDQTRVDPNDVVLFEAHGTGTPVGDPVEALAIGSAYGALKETPLTVGSAKGNFGHLEPASGLVGLLKAQMALEHGCIPATLHADTLNASIAFKDLNIDIARTKTPMNPDQKTRIAAVNSFGFGGANAHVLIKRDQSMDETPSVPPKQYPALRLSAASDAALRDLATDWRNRMTSPRPLPATAIENANWRTSQFRNQLCVPADSATNMAAALEGWLEETTPSPVATGQAGTHPARVGFVFAGNGAVWNGMARDIYAADPTFRRSIQRTGRLFRQMGGIDICKTLLSDDLGSYLGQAETDQSLLFAIQIALVAALKKQGLRPHAVAGHSVGEVAAAVTSGAISTETGVHIILARSRRFESLRNKGTMAALAGSADNIRDLIKKQGTTIEIAAHNTDTSVTVTGAGQEIDQLLRVARKEHIAGRRLKIDYPYHSSAVDQLELDLRSDLDTITARAPRVPIFASCTGDEFDHPLDSDFWWMNARQPVQFASAIKAMCATDITLLIEISPRAVLQSYLRQIVKDSGANAVVLRGLEQSATPPRVASSIALEAAAHSAEMDSCTLFGSDAALDTDLPLYPFERSEYRLSYADGLNVLGGTHVQHPLLGEKLIADGTEWRNELSVGVLAWTLDHKVHDQIVLPATAIVEMFREAAEQILASSAFSLTDLTFQRATLLSETQPRQIRMIYDASVSTLTLQIRTKDVWQTQATARILQTTQQGDQRILLDWGDNPRHLYEVLEGVGLHYGPLFRCTQSVARNGNVIDVRLQRDGIIDKYGFDPISGDVCLHAIATVLEHVDSALRTPYLPTRIERFEHVSPDPIAGARLTLVGQAKEQITLDVTFVTSTGTVAARMIGLALTPLRHDARTRALVWEEVMIPITNDRATSLGVSAPDTLLSKRPPIGDIEALRAAIGGRIAWDIVHDGVSPADVDILAKHVLKSSKLVENDGKTHASPWPAKHVLVDLLAKALPTATDELQSALDAICNADVQNFGITSLSQAAENLCAQIDLSKARVALVGNIDPGFAITLARTAGHTLLATATPEDANDIKYQFPPNAMLSIRNLDTAAAGHAFDYVIGVDLARSCPSTSFAKIRSLLKPGGQFYTVEEGTDAFSLMTGRHVSSSVLADLIRQFRSAGLDLRQSYLAQSPTVRILTAASQSAPSDTSVNWTIMGSGPIADALRNATHLDAPKMTGIILNSQPDNVAASDQIWQTLRKLSPTSDPVWIVQHGTIGDAALRGWRRCYVNETKLDLRTACVDTGTDLSFVASVLGSTAEQELIFSDSSVKAPRLRPMVDARGDANAALKLTKSQDPNGPKLRWKSTPRQAPQDTEIEVAVTSTGLNFRDLMWAQDLLPFDAMNGGFAGATLGMECAGLVQRAGQASGFSVGQPVLLVSPAAFATHVTIDAKCAVALHADIDLVTAAGLPVAAMTALYALKEVAHLRKNQTVLIHAAAGGVGLAAVQIAQSIGARIIATAGTDKKRAFLKALDVAHVLNSRTLDFGDEVRKITDGRGVDVVLNSLSGPAMEMSVGCLAPFGRFVELGKRDFFANTALPLRPFRRNISYFGIDMDQLFQRRPDTVARLFKQISGQLETSKLDTLPTHVFSSDGVSEAFNHMQSARHIGKIVITPPKIATPPSQQAAKPIRGTWLVVGGTGGFGLETAKWLARQGAESLWLVSKSGRVAENNVAVVKGIAAQIHIQKCDIGDLAQVEGLVAEMTKHDGQISGVVHAAMILRDKLISDLSDDDVAAVTTPKILGAENLDRATRDHELDYFLLYGSVSARFGTIGQAPYVAANMALEEIAARRSAAGLAGLSIAWGPIGDAGYLARETGLRDILEAELGPCMSAQAALARFGVLLRAGVNTPAITIAPNVVPASALVCLDSPLFSDIRRKSSDTPIATSFDLGKMIANKGESAAREFLLELMRKEAGRIMRMSPSAVDVSRPLNEIGFDSLMGVNFLLNLEKQFAQSVSIPQSSMDLSLVALVSKIMETSTVTNGPKILGEMAAKHVSSTDISAEEIAKIKDATAGQGPNE